MTGFEDRNNYILKVNNLVLPVGSWHLKESINEDFLLSVHVVTDFDIAPLLDRSMPSQTMTLECLNQAPLSFSGTLQKTIHRLNLTEQWDHTLAITSHFNALKKDLCDRVWAKKTALDAIQDIFKHNQLHQFWNPENDHCTRFLETCPWILQTASDDFSFLRDLIKNLQAYFIIHPMTNLFSIHAGELPTQADPAKTLAYISGKGMNDSGAYSCCEFNYKIDADASLQLEITTNQPLQLGECLQIENLPLGTYTGFVHSMTQTGNTNPSKSRHGLNPHLSPMLYECKAVLQQSHPAVQSNLLRTSKIFKGSIESTQPHSYPDLDQHGRQILRLDFDHQNKPGQGSYRIPKLHQQAHGQMGIQTPLPSDAKIALTLVDGDPDQAVILGALGNREPIVNTNAQEYCLKTKGGNRIVFNQTKEAAGIHMHTPQQKQSLVLGNGHQPRLEFSTESGGLYFNCQNKLKISAQGPWQCTVLKQYQCSVKNNITHRYKQGHFTCKTTNNAQFQTQDILFLEAAQTAFLIAKNHFQIHSSEGMSVNTRLKHEVTAAKNISIRGEMGHLLKANEQIHLGSKNNAIQLKGSKMNILSQRFSCQAPIIRITSPLENNVE